MFKKIQKNWLLGYLVFLLVSCPLWATAQGLDKLALTITPPLIKINMNAGEFWSSSVKLVNTNPQPLLIYASILDFRANEKGGLKFLNQKESLESNSFLLSRWVEIPLEPIEVPVQKSIEVPFSIKVPEDAEPGGHYAAILLGTKPFEKGEGSAIKISALVASLIMLNIQGEIREEGLIREFSTNKNFYQKPEVEFTTRFENAGNVHLQPQGEIRIYNFLGKERGIIPINQKTDFGNVLPQSIRKWVFQWKSEQSIFEVGRFKAVLVLSYGSEARETVSAIRYFWIVPLKPTLGVAGGFIFFVLLMVLGLRFYIRKVIAAAQREAGLAAENTLSRRKIPARAFVAPIVEGVIDLRRGRPKKEDFNETKKAPKFYLLKKYLELIFLILVFILWLISAVFYFKDVSQKEKSFEVIVPQEAGSEIIISN